jgi:transposase
MRTGWYRALHVKSPACRSWRALPTARRMVLNKRRDLENGIRALREVGLKSAHRVAATSPRACVTWRPMTRCWPAWQSRC